MGRAAVAILRVALEMGSLRYIFKREDAGSGEFREFGERFARNGSRVILRIGYAVAGCGQFFQ